MSLTQISASFVIVASGLVLFLMALPAIVGAIKSVGFVRTLLLLVGLCCLIIGFEFMATKSSLIYGEFNYSSAFGQQLFGKVPAMVALAFPPVIIGTFWIASRLKTGALSALFSSLFATIIYLVTAPAMAKLTLWQWKNPGAYFGVPIRAYAGWFILTFISSLFVAFIFNGAEKDRKMVISLLAILLFWTGVNLGVSNWIPALIGLVYSIVIVLLIRVDKRTAG